MGVGTGEKIRKVRIEKLSRLQKLQGVRYPNTFRPSGDIASVLALFEADGFEEHRTEVAVAGRVMAVNSFGKAAFLRIQDWTGKVQLYVRKSDVSPEDFEKFRLTDAGDIVAVKGTLFHTRTGERTVQVKEYAVLSKCLIPLPEKWHGLRDRELRQRMRYLDLIVNPDARRVFLGRTAIVRHIRRFLDERGFVEVETPMMHPVLGGANARPFVTHHAALDMDLYLRIAPELYLKRLVTGGFERVYELNRNFRNEGISTRHNPEFTMLEFYMAYATYEDLMRLTEEMLSGLVQSIHQTTRLTYQGKEIDFSTPFRRLTVEEAVQKYASARPDSFSSLDSAKKFALEKGVDQETVQDVVRTERDEHDACLRLMMEVFEAVVEEHLVQPTFVTHYPAVVSPLARPADGDPRFVDRFELYVACGEIANAFSELNDPMLQRERFRRQVEMKVRGDREAMEYDEDYVRCLEHGMPPTAGEGIGIDRLTMLLYDQPSIRDVILFPLLKPARS